MASYSKEGRQHPCSSAWIANRKIMSCENFMKGSVAFTLKDDPLPLKWYVPTTIGRHLEQTPYTLPRGTDDAKSL